MQTVADPDDRQWRVGRRRLAWQPRVPDWLKMFVWIVDGPGDPILWLPALVSLVVVIPGLLWYGLNWLVCLLVTPFTWLGRTVFGRPWLVVAYAVNNYGAEYRANAADLAAADALVKQVTAEIRDGGRPRSLRAPGLPQTLRVWRQG